nr:hypothetical protein [Tanacetum cinerariifolium]
MPKTISIDQACCDYALAYDVVVDIVVLESDVGDLTSEHKDIVDMVATQIVSMNSHNSSCNNNTFLVLVIKGNSMKEKILLNVNSGMEFEIMCNITSHPLRETRRHGGEIGFLYEAEVKKWSSQYFYFAFSCKLLAVGYLFFWQWEHPPLAVGTYTASGNSLLAVGMPCAFYSQHCHLPEWRISVPKRHDVLSPNILEL